jgi:hypothetical protein
LQTWAPTTIHVDVYASSHDLLDTNDCVSPSFEKHTTCFLVLTGHMASSGYFPDDDDRCKKKEELTTGKGKKLQSIKVFNKNNLVSCNYFKISCYIILKNVYSFYKEFHLKFKLVFITVYLMLQKILVQKIASLIKKSLTKKKKKNT